MFNSTFVENDMKIVFPLYKGVKGIFSVDSMMFRVPKKFMHYRDTIIGILSKDNISIGHGVKRKLHVNIFEGNTENITNECKCIQMKNLPRVFFCSTVKHICGYHGIFKEKPSSETINSFDTVEKISLRPRYLYRIGPSVAYRTIKPPKGSQYQSIMIGIQ